MGFGAWELSCEHKRNCEGTMGQDKEQIILETRNLTKIYNQQLENEFEALHGINFKAQAGEFLCVMGPSGSGKTTFINNISTVDFPTKGQVFIDGVEIHSMSSNQLGRFRSQKLGFVFQEFNLLDTHTLYENIAMPLALAKVKKTEIQKRVEEIAERMGIHELLRKYPRECSGGQRQRGAICRALVMNPKIVVADEPTGNLDQKNSREIVDLLKLSNCRFHQTILMITHDEKLALEADRIIILEDGHIISDERQR